jgi:D-alanine-D-alanine ligase
LSIEIANGQNNSLKESSFAPSIEVIIIPDENLKNTAFGLCKTCEDVYNAIASKYSNTKMTICNDDGDLQAVLKRKPNLVVLTNKIMLVSSKKIWLSEYFETNNINFTGSTKKVLQYDMNKISSKRQVMSFGVDTPRFFTATPDEFCTPESLPIPFPLFIKPLESANSDGIDEKSFVYNFASFQKKVKELYDMYKQVVLIEEYLAGKEFTVAIIEAEEMLIAPIEIVAPLKNDIRILSKKIKNDNTETIEKIIDTDVYQRVSAIAKTSFEALGARDYGRIDIKMDSHGRCYFLEANLTPGMTKGSSYFPRSYELCSMLEYDDVVCLLIQASLKRGKYD